MKNAPTLSEKKAFIAHLRETLEHTEHVPEAMHATLTALLLRLEETVTAHSEDDLTAREMQAIDELALLAGQQADEEIRQLSKNQEVLSSRLEELTRRAHALQKEMQAEEEQDAAASIRANLE